MKRILLLFSIYTYLPSYYMEQDGVFPYHLHLEAYLLAIEGCWIVAKKHPESERLSKQLTRLHAFMKL